MGALPRNFLSKKGGQWRPIRLLDIAILLFHAHQAAEDPEVGFEDAQETLDTFTRKLNKVVNIDPAVLESALWSCNLLNEQGKFKHPRGVTFNEWVKTLVRSHERFHPVYNLIEAKENK